MIFDFNIYINKRNKKMAVYKFFNKQGDLITPIYDVNKKTFTFCFNDVSVDLFETIQLHIFEEVYVPDDTLKNETFNPIEQDTLIKILELIYDNTRSFETTYIEQISWNVYGIEYNDFLNSFDIQNRLNEYKTYIEQVIETDGKISYILTEQGLNYYREYISVNEEQLMASLGYKKMLVTPRDIYTTDIRTEIIDGKEIEINRGEDVKLFFKWNDTNKLDENEIFIFNITDTKNPYPKEKLKNDYYLEYLPNIVRYSNTDLDARLSNTWQILSNRYRFIEAEDDLFVDNKEVFNLPFNFFDDVHRVVKTTKNLSTHGFTINFGINSDREGVFKRQLEIYKRYTDYVFEIDPVTELPVHVKLENGENKTEVSFEHFLTINFEGEVFDNDERFEILLGNMGRKIDESDMYVIKSFPIDDDKPDYLRVNNKRKELLLEGNEIFPFMGSYKAFYNALKWLEFQDIQIREYFYNAFTWQEDKFIEYKSYKFDTTLDTNWKYNVVELETKGKISNYAETIFNDIKFDPLNPDTNAWKKTTRLGLVWQYNDYTGDIDSFGYPVITNKNDFNPEEILIKLYGLKNVLYKYFLPHNARIISIALEGVYFVKFRLLNWNNIVPIKKERKVPDYTIKAFPEKQSLDNIWNIMSGMYRLDLTDEQLCEMTFPLASHPSFLERTACSFVSGKKDISNKLAEFVRNNFENASEFRDFIKGYHDLNMECLDCEDGSHCYLNQKVAVFLLSVIEDRVSWEQLKTVKWQTLEEANVNWQRIYERLFLLSDALNDLNDRFNEKNPNDFDFNNILNDIRALPKTELTDYEIQIMVDNFHNNMVNHEITHKLGFMIDDQNAWIEAGYYDYWLNQYNKNEDKIRKYLWDAWWEIHGEKRIRWTITNQKISDKTFDTQKDYSKRWEIDNYGKVKIPVNTDVVIKDFVEDGNIVKTIEGLVKDLRNVLYIAYTEGKFNVKVDIYDNTNAPKIVKEDGLFEVIEEPLQIYAFENENEFIERPSDYLSGFDWEDTEYIHYLNQFFIKDYLQYFTFQFDNNKNLVIENDFWRYFRQYSKNWDNVYFMKSHFEIPKRLESPVEYTEGNKIRITKQENQVLPDNLVNWHGYALGYRKYISYSFNLEKVSEDIGKITLNVSEDYMKSRFKICNYIVLYGKFYVTHETLEDYKVIREINEEETEMVFPILDVFIDYEKSIVELYVQDNGSLVYGENLNIIPDNEFLHNFTNKKNNNFHTSWYRLEYYYNAETFRVNTIEEDDFSLILYTEYKQSVLEKKYFDFICLNVQSGLLSLKIENGNIIKNEDVLCKLSNDYKIVAAPFDWKNAWERINFNLLDKRYHSAPLQTFYIDDFNKLNSNSRPILIIDGKYFHFTIPNDPTKEKYQLVIDALNDISYSISEEQVIPKQTFWLYGWENVNDDLCIRINKKDYLLHVDKLITTSEQKLNNLLKSLNNANTPFFFEYDNEREMIQAIEKIASGNEYELLMINLNGIKSPLKIYGNSTGYYKTERLENEKVITKYKDNPEMPFYFVWNETHQMIQAIEKRRSGKLRTLDASLISIFNNEKDTWSYGGWATDEYYEFKGIDNPTKHVLSRKENGLESSFRYNNTSLYRENEKQNIAIGTPLFITLTNKEHWQKYNYDFDWTLIDEMSDRTVCMSNEDYLLWLCDKYTIYTVKLKLTNKKTGEIKMKEVKNWIGIN